MNLINLKNCVCLSMMIVLLLIAFLTKDAGFSQLFASFGIIVGAYIFQRFGKQDSNSIEKSTDRE